MSTTAAAAALADEEFVATVETDDAWIAGAAAVGRALGTGARLRLGPDGKAQLLGFSRLPFAVQAELEWLQEDVKQFLAPRTDADPPPGRRRFRVRGGEA
jgi:hypothetical protein